LSETSIRPPTLAPPPEQGLFPLEGRGPGAALGAIRFGLLAAVVLAAVALEEVRVKKA
jgi:hypothetical protein